MALFMTFFHVIFLLDFAHYIGKAISICIFFYNQILQKFLLGLSVLIDSLDFTFWNLLR